jgi:A/G-specific adenine glycosylase
MSKRRTTQNPDPKATYRKLSRWFAKNARPFPWRGETDPYRVWISEIILVQTTAAVGVPRYQRFIKRFPTLKSLMSASVDDVMKEWEGLGYYHRARNLHRAAQVICNEHKGRFPAKYEDIRKLPGVGDYCAAAIHNFCYGGRWVPLDANVARVGARLFGIHGDIKASKTRRAVHNKLSQLMTIGTGAMWTEGLIGLGATVCTPRSPKCGECPLSDSCRAMQSGHQLSLGVAEKRAVRKVVDVACGIIRRADGRILIAQRLETGLLPNLWEFPGGKRDGNESLAETCRREIQEELAVDVEVGKGRMMIEHAYSHYAVRLHVFECRYVSGLPRPIGCQRFRWIKVHELERLAFPAANKRIITALASGL